MINYSALQLCWAIGRVNQCQNGFWGKSMSVDCILSWNCIWWMSMSKYINLLIDWYHVEWYVLMFSALWVCVDSVCVRVCVFMFSVLWVCWQWVCVCLCFLYCECVCFYVFCTVSVCVCLCFLYCECVDSECVCVFMFSVLWVCWQCVCCLLCLPYSSIDGSEDAGELDFTQLLKKRLGSPYVIIYRNYHTVKHSHQQAYIYFYIYISLHIT